MTFNEKIASLPAEFSGTGLLLLGGLSLVIFMFGTGSIASEFILQ